MLLHEGAEQVLGLPHHVRVVFLDRDHGQSGVGVHGHHVGDRRAQRKALDAAAELLRQQERRVQGRRHRGVVLGGNENGFHARVPIARDRHRAIILPRGPHAKPLAGHGSHEAASRPPAILTAIRMAG